METLCQAISDQVLTKVLTNEGIDPTKYLLWYDASGLTADPDNTDHATNAYDRGVITAEAYRDFMGLGNTGYDLTTLDGWKVWAQDAVSKDPKLFPQFLPLLDAKVQSLDFAPTQPAIGGRDAKPGQADTTNQGNNPQTEKKGPGYDQGKRGRKSDVASKAIVEVMVFRALELAGKRRRTRADIDRLRGLKPQHFHRVMEPVSDAEVSDLIKGWDDALEAETLALVGMDIDEVRNEVHDEVRRQLTAQTLTA
jgi:hypothetical protein